MKNSVENSTGQTFMPDFLASMVVFGVILTVFFFSWNSIVHDHVKFKDEKEMMFQGRHTAAFLVSSPGYPEDWNSSSVQIPGFAEPDHVLREEKLEEFRDIDYERQRSLLEARQFYLSIENESGVMRLNGQKLEYGKNYSDADTVVPFTRTVQANISGKILDAELNYVVWQ